MLGKNSLKDRVTCIWKFLKELEAKIFKIEKNGGRGFIDVWLLLL